MKRVLIFMLLLSSPAVAQPAASPSVDQRVLATTQAQRNQLIDALNLSDARNAVNAEELAKALAKIKELEAKPEDKK